MRALLLLICFVATTKAIIDFNLPEIPKDEEKLTDLKADEKEDVDCPRCRHHHHFPPPPFLRKVSPRARREFYRIVTNKDTTGNQKKQQLDDWANKQGKDILNDLHDFEAKVQKFYDRVHTGMEATSKALPDAYNKVYAILANRDLTPRQMWEKLLALKLDPTLARTLRATYFFVIHQRKPTMKDFQLTPLLGLHSLTQEDMEDY